MRIWKILVKSLREQTRDMMSFSLSLLLTPVFVGLYWLFFGGGSTSYSVLIMNNDKAVETAGGEMVSFSEGVLETFEEITYPNGQPILKVRFADDQTNAEDQLKSRKTHVLLIIPEDFSETILAAKMGEDIQPAEITFIGDVTNPYYILAAVMAYDSIDSYIQSVTGETSPIQMIEKPLSGSIARTEFDLYIPGLLVFSVVMMLFDASMAVSGEVESGTFDRLRITKVTAFELLAGISASVVVLGLVSILLTFITASLLGFTSVGPIWLAFLIGAITCFGVIGVGLMVAAVSKTTSRAFVIANFPLTLFMFFSGAIYPLPPVNLFTVGDITVNLYDILPPTHAVTALNKIMSLGVGLNEVAYELTALVVLSLLYFGLGVWLFKRQHMKAW